MTYFVARCYDCMQKHDLTLTQLTFCFEQRWVAAFQEGIFPTIVRTTNGLERQHQKLKYSFLSDTSNGSLSELVSTTVKEFVPICHRRYASILCCIFRRLRKAEYSRFMHNTRNVTDTRNRSMVETLASRELHFILMDP